MTANLTQQSGIQTCLINTTVANEKLEGRENCQEYQINVVSKYAAAQECKQNRPGTSPRKIKTVKKKGKSLLLAEK